LAVAIAAFLTVLNIHFAGGVASGPRFGKGEAPAIESLTNSRSALLTPIKKSDIVGAGRTDRV